MPEASSTAIISAGRQVLQEFTATKASRTEFWARASFDPLLDLGGLAVPGSSPSRLTATSTECRSTETTSASQYAGAMSSCCSAAATITLATSPYAWAHVAASSGIHIGPWNFFWWQPLVSSALVPNGHSVSFCFAV